MKKILIVDDSETLRDQLNEVLTGQGYEVIQGHDGLNGLEVAKKNTDISLVISDFNMPERDGISMIEGIKQIEELKDIPVFMLTTESGKELMKRGKKAGVMAWIVKPFDTEELIEVLDHVLKEAA